MNPSTYLYVLNRNCVQFEPDHPNYIKTAQFVYDYIDAHGDYEVLHSTRHFGPMVFYLTHSKKIDNLLIYYMKKLNPKDASQVIRLYLMIHPNSKLSRERSLSEKLQDMDDLSLIRKYISMESRKETKVRMTLESMLETMEKNRNTLKDMQNS